MQEGWVPGLIGMVVVGLFAGALARLLVPGRDPMGCLGTIVLGVVGSFVGGLLGSVIFYGDLELRSSHNFPGAVLGAMVALLIFRVVSGRNRRNRRRRR